MSRALNNCNVKLIDRYGTDGGRWFIDPADRPMIVFINRELRAYQRLEPSADWHLETCGSISAFHRVEDELPF